MRVAVFVNTLGLGGSEKAACRWTRGLQERGHELVTLSLHDGPRRAELEAAGLETRVVPIAAERIAAEFREWLPDVIHAHAPGHLQYGDVLGEALARFPKIPVVQTNIFGQLDNPREDQWTDFRLFVSWTSCVQAARRSFQKLDAAFFRRSSVSVYPLDADDGPDPGVGAQFREIHGIRADEVLFGRLSRPDAAKWTDLPVQAFRLALRTNPRLKLLLREPPPAVAEHLKASPDRERFLILPATNERDELRRTMASLDAVLHASSIGESFGYGVAEPMNFGKPVIANSTPWADQAQLELVRHGEGGFIASTPRRMAEAILALANPDRRAEMGQRAQRHIRAVADPTESLDRLESALQAVVAGRDNPNAATDLARATTTAAYLDQEQLGHTWQERLALCLFHYRVRFSQWRRAMRLRCQTTSG